MEDGTEQSQEILGKLHCLYRCLAEELLVEADPRIIVDYPGEAALLGNKA